MPNLLLKFVFVLILNQFILNSPNIQADAVHNRHLNFHHSLEHLNSAIYHQLLSAELNSPSNNKKAKSQRSISSKTSLDSYSSHHNSPSHSPLSSFDQSIDKTKSDLNQISSLINKSKESSSLKNINKQFDIKNKKSIDNGIDANKVSNKEQLILKSSDHRPSNETELTSEIRKEQKISSSIEKHQEFSHSYTLLSNSSSALNSSFSKNKSRRSTKLPELVRRVPCDTNKDCQFTNICDPNTKMCTCPRNYINVKDLENQKDIEKPINWPPTHCYQATALEKSCIYDEQCVVQHSKCTRDENLGQQLHCTCSIGYTSKGEFFFGFCFFYFQIFE